MILLEHWIAVEGQIILDHAVGNLLWHLGLGHLMLWQILSCEAGAVDGGGEGVIDGAASQVELLQALDKGLVDLMVFGNGGKVNHGCGVVRVLRVCV
jgi:hypothetical protein